MSESINSEIEKKMAAEKLKKATAELSFQLREVYALGLSVEILTNDITTISSIVPQTYLTVRIFDQTEY